MKKLTLAIALALSCSFMTQAAFADDIAESHDMNIYGRLQTAKSGCNVLMSKYIINLNNTASSLPEQGEKVNSTVADDKIYITLGGEDCDASEGYLKIGLKFIGNVDSVEGNTLANTDTSSAAAQGVGIQLSDMFDKILKPNVDVGLFPNAVISNGTSKSAPSYPLNFSLVHLKNHEATSGSVKTNLVVQIERL